MLNPHNTRLDRGSPPPYARMVAVTYIHKVLFDRGRGKPLATVSLRKSCLVRRSRRSRAEGSPRPVGPVPRLPLIVTALFLFPITFAEQLSSLQVVAPENRCTEYSRDLYPYSLRTVVSIPYDGEEGFYNLYTGRSFEQGEGLSIEHIVPLSEGHDSGLCAASPEARQQFASDPFNLTVIPKWLNSEKGGRDLAEWLPEANQCWYVERYLEVKRKYGLTIDRAEWNAAEAVLASCPASPALQLLSGTGEFDWETFDFERWDANGNGRLSCDEVEKQGAPLPVVKGTPAYEHLRDTDGDGVVCE